MEFFNKAKEAISGGDSSSSKDKKDSSIFSKAMEAAEKYHAKEKVAEFAQKRVAKREEEKRQPGYTEKDKSVIDKAVQAAEDFLAKQGDSPKDDKADKPKENVEAAPGRRRSCSDSSSSSSHSEPEKCPQPARNPEPPRSYPSYPPNGAADVEGSLRRMNLGSDTAPASGPMYDPPTLAPSYPSAAEGYPSYDGNSRCDCPNGSTSGRYETYQEYWNRQGNYPSQSHPSYPPGAASAGYGHGERTDTNGYAYQGNVGPSYGYPGYGANDHV